MAETPESRMGEVKMETQPSFAKQVLKVIELTIVGMLAFSALLALCIGVGYGVFEASYALGLRGGLEGNIPGHPGGTHAYFLGIFIGVLTFFILSLAFFSDKKPEQSPE